MFNKLVNCWYLQLIFPALKIPSFRVLPYPSEAAQVYAQVIRFSDAIEAVPSSFALALVDLNHGWLTDLRNAYSNH